MIKKTLNSLIFLLIVFCSVLFIGKAALAAGLSVQFEQKPLFNETNFVPGDSVTRWAKVTNTSGETQKIAVEAINVSDNDNFGNALNLQIKEGPSTLFDDTLSNFFDAGEVYLSDLGDNANTQYDFIITFTADSSNAYQSKTLGFDFLIGFQGQEGNFTGVPSGGGAGGVTIVGLTITNEATSVVSTDSVTITWNTSYNSTSQVIFAPEGGNHTLVLSAPNYGYDYALPDPENTSMVTSHSVTLTGLVPNTTYYYRCVSHASPPTISQEHSFTTMPQKATVKKALPSGQAPSPQPSEEAQNNTPSSEPISKTKAAEIAKAKPLAPQPSAQSASGNVPQPAPSAISVQAKTLATTTSLSGLTANLANLLRNIPWWVLVLIAMLLLIGTLLTKKREA